MAEHGVACSPERVVLVDGALHGLDLVLRLLVPRGGSVLVVLWRLRPLERAVDWSIERALRRVQWLEPKQVTELIEFGDHVVARISVGPASWLVDRTLRQMRLHDEGVLVLTCTRADGTRLLSPGADTRIEVGDEIPLQVGERARTPDEIMLEVTRAFEVAIRRDPANWFWVHRRWKPAPPGRGSPPLGSDPEMALG